MYSSVTYAMIENLNIMKYTVKHHTTTTHEWTWSPRW